MPNAKLAYQVLDHIDAHPEQWDQETYYEVNECGTTACFAGWTVILSKVELNAHGDVLLSSLPHEVADLVGQIRSTEPSPLEDPQLAEIADVARVLLGIDRDQRGSLFYADNDREDLGTLVGELFGPRPLTDDGALSMTPAEVEAELARDPLGRLVHVVTVPGSTRPCGAETGQAVDFADFLRVTCPRCEHNLRVIAARLLVTLAFPAERGHREHF